MYTAFRTQIDEPATAGTSESKLAEEEAPAIAQPGVVDAELGPVVPEAAEAVVVRSPALKGSKGSTHVLLLLLLGEHPLVGRWRVAAT